MTYFDSKKSEKLDDGATVIITPAALRAIRWVRQQQCLIEEGSSLTLAEPEDVPEADVREAIEAGLIEVVAVLGGIRCLVLTLKGWVALGSP